MFAVGHYPDFHPDSAIKRAEEHATKNGVKCTFLVADVLGDLENVTETFDFAYDWELLHHIFLEQRQQYVANVHRLLNPKGKYLSLCFNESDPAFGGAGKYRRTPLGTVLYFSSLGELRALFEPPLQFSSCGLLKSTANPRHISPAIASWSGGKRMDNRWHNESWVYLLCEIIGNEA